MQRALGLARETAGQASPNPRVGCVLVRDGQVIGEGAHIYQIYDHAEIVALKGAGLVAKDANEVVGSAKAVAKSAPKAGTITAFVTLEPCSHHGRTGPCADALIAAGIATCHVATVDPNPQVSGRGIARMRAAGIEVQVGLCQAEARALNNAFACSITENRPFVTLKAALSVDGRLAPPPGSRHETAPFWVTGPEAREAVQTLRHGSDAILTGIGTVLADDPQLTDRTGLERRRPLLRVVLDRHLRIPLNSRLVRSTQEDLWIFHGEDADLSVETELKQRGIRVSRAASLADVMRHLHEMKMQSVLLEAGPGLNGAFLREALVDAVTLFYAETELGPGGVPFSADGTTPFALEQRLTGLAKRNVGKDVEISGLLRDPWADLG